MICLTPTTIKNPKFETDSTARDRFILVPCRKCKPCMDKRAQHWAFRLRKEEERSYTASFMTYTYNDKELPRSKNNLPTLHQKHHTNFMKRLRKELKKNGITTKVSYYAVGEYGSETQRPHYHSILFNLPEHYILNTHHIERIWGHGHISIDTVTPASIAYVCGYVNKQKYFTTDDPNDDRAREFSVMSKHLGENFLTPQRKQRMRKLLEPTMHIEDGKVMAIPEYYRRKTLDEKQRKVLAEKSLQYVEQHPIFKTEKQKMDYVQNVAYLRDRNAKSIRRKV